MAWKPPFSLAEIVAFAEDERVVLRARTVVSSGVMKITRRQEGEYTAVVRGSVDDYRVSLSRGAAGFASECTCPVGRRTRNPDHCKHVIALGLMWLADDGETVDHGSIDPDLSAALDSLALPDARAMLMDLAGQVPGLRDRLLGRPWKPA